MNKDSFFYSNSCENCKLLINVIVKKGLRDMFLFVPVDRYKHMLPPCVTHVPTIITRQKEVLTGEYIDSYIERFSGDTQTEEVSPYAFAGGYSSSYTWLTDNGYDNDGALSMQKESSSMKGCVPYGSESRIIAPNDPDTGKSSKFDDSTYERYINSRNADDEVIKRTMNATTRT